MKTLKHLQTRTWVWRTLTLIVLLAFGSSGLSAQSSGGPANGYYRLTTASTTEIVGSALYDYGGSVRWKTLDENDIAFVWRVDATQDGFYRLTNPLMDISFGDDGKVELLKQESGAYAIKQPSGTGWLHALSHGQVSVDTGGDVTFGTTGWGFNTWYFEKVDESDPLLKTAIDAKALSAKARKAVSENSKDLTPTAAQEEANNYADFFSNAGMTVEHGITFGSDGAGFKGLIDGDAGTFFHSSWNGEPAWSDYQDDGINTVSKNSAVKTDYAYATTLHNLGVKLTEASDYIYLQWTERAGKYSSTPTSINLEVSNDRQNWTSVCTDYKEFSVSDAGGANVMIGPFKLDKPYQYVRFSCNSAYRRNEGINNPAKYFNLSELRVYALKDKLAAAGGDAVSSLFGSVYTLENSGRASELNRAIANINNIYGRVFEGIISGDTIINDGYYVINLPDAEDNTLCFVPVPDGEKWRLGAYPADMKSPSAEYIWHVTRDAATNTYTLKNCGEQETSYPNLITKGAYESSYILMTGKKLQSFRITLNADKTAYIYSTDNINNFSYDATNGYVGVANRHSSNSLVQFLSVEPTDALRLNEALSDAAGHHFTVGTEPGEVSEEDYNAFSTAYDAATAERTTPTAGIAAATTALTEATAALDGKTNAFADGYYYIVSTKDNSKYLTPAIESNNTYVGLKTTDFTSGSGAIVWHITTNTDGERVMKNCALADSSYLAPLSSRNERQTVRMGLRSLSHQNFSNIYGNVFRIYSSSTGSYLDESAGTIYTSNEYYPENNSEWAVVSVPESDMPRFTTLAEAITDARAAIISENVSSDPGGAFGDATKINAALAAAESTYADNSATEEQAADAAASLKQATTEFLAQDHSQTNPVTEGYYRLVNEDGPYMGTGTPAAYAKNGHLFWGPLKSNDPHFVFKITPKEGNSFYVQSALYNTHFGTLDSLGLVALQSEEHAVMIDNYSGRLWTITNPDDNNQYVRGGGGDEVNAEFRVRATYSSDFTHKQHNWYLKRLTDADVQTLNKEVDSVRIKESLTNAIARGERAFSGAFRYDVDYNSPLISDVNADFPRDGQVWSMPREHDKSWGGYANMLKGGFRCEDSTDIDNKKGVPLQVDLKDNAVKDFEIKYIIPSKDWMWRESWADITVYATNDETVAGKDDLTPSEWKFVGHYTDLPVDYGWQDHDRTFKYRIIDADQPYRFYRFMVNKTIMPQAYGRFFVTQFNMYAAVANESGSPYNYIEGMKDAADHLRSLTVAARTKLDDGTATQADVDALNAAAKAVEDLTPNADHLNALISEVNAYIAKYGTSGEWGDVTEDEYYEIQDAVTEADSYDHANPDITDLAKRYSALDEAFALYKSRQKKVETGKWYRIVSTDSQREGTKSQGGTADDSHPEFSFVKNRVIFASLDGKVGTGLHNAGYDYLNAQRADSVDSSPYAMWRLALVDTAAGTYSLQNRATGLYLGVYNTSASRGMQETAAPYSLTLLKSGQYAISCADNNDGRYALHAYGAGSVGIWNNVMSTVPMAADSPSSWNFEEVDESLIDHLSVDIPDNSLRIVTLPFAYTHEAADANEANGIMAYSIAGISEDGSMLNLTQKTSFAAGEPFIIVANDYTQTDGEPSTVQFALPFVNEFSREALTSNGLVGTFADINPKTAGLGYISDNRIVATNAYTPIPAYTGYISTGLVKNIPNASVDLQLNLPEGVNGIAAATISGAKATVDVYTLDGVLLKKGVKASEAANGLKKGVYIIGKKKVLVK